MTLSDLLLMAEQPLKEWLPAEIDPAKRDAVGKLVSDEIARSYVEDTSDVHKCAAAATAVMQLAITLGDVAEVFQKAVVTKLESGVYNG